MAYDPQNPAASIPTPQPTRPGVDWAAVMQKLGPLLQQMGQGRPPGQGMAPVPGTAPQMPGPPTMGSAPSGGSGLDIKADPRAGSFMPPPAAEAPQRQAQGYQPYQGAYALTPKNQGAYDAVQGVSSFIQKWTQKKDQEKHAEAANAAQALMQALESGDHMSADHIFHQNEKLFNKVYKGWIQKAEDAAQPQKQEKPDPEAQGVEAGMQQYLHGKKSNYMIPRATPTQQAGQQQASSMNQALQQQPSMGIPGGYVTPEEQAKLSVEQEKTKAAFQKLYADSKKADVEFQTAQTNFQKAQQEAKAAASKGATEQETAKSNAARASSEASAAASRVDITKTQLLIEQAKLQGVKTGKGAKIPASIQKQFASLNQAQQIVTATDAKKGFAPDQFMSLQNLLVMSGMPTYSKSLTTSWLRGHLMPGTNYADPSAISETLDNQKKALLQAFPGLEPDASEKDGGEADTGDDTDDNAVELERGPDGKLRPKAQ